MFGQPGTIDLQNPPNIFEQRLEGRTVQPGVLVGEMARKVGSVVRVAVTHRQFKIRQKWNELFQVGWNIKSYSYTPLKKCKDKAVDSFINRQTPS